MMHLAVLAQRSNNNKITHLGDVQQVTDFYTQISILLVKLVEAGNGLEPRPVEGGHRSWEA
jgi:hypothetical protein